MSVVYAKESAVIFREGTPVNIAKGAAWDSGSDVVKAAPGLFDSEPTDVQGRPRIERATRAPGERSNARDTQTPADKKAAAAAKRKATMEAKKAAAAKAKADAKEPGSDGAE